MSFWDRMQEVVNQGLESSREILGKAKEQATVSKDAFEELLTDIRELKDRLEKLEADLKEAGSGRERA
jgi:predicted  nucleic acid-binding Zn-ribbon protein